MGLAPPTRLPTIFMNVTFETISGSIYEVKGNQLCQNKPGKNYVITGRGRAPIGNWKEFEHISKPEVGKRVAIHWGNSMTLTNFVTRVVENG